MSKPGSSEPSAVFTGEGSGLCTGGLGVLGKDPLGTGVEKQSISCLKLHRAERRPPPSGQSPGLSFTHIGAGRLGGLREEWCLLVGLVLCFPLTTVWCLSLRLPGRDAA